MISVTIVTISWFLIMHVNFIEVELNTNSTGFYLEVELWVLLLENVCHVINEVQTKCIFCGNFLQKEGDKFISDEHKAGKIQSSQHTSILTHIFSGKLDAGWIMLRYLCRWQLWDSSWCSCRTMVVKKTITKTKQVCALCGLTFLFF